MDLLFDAVTLQIAGLVLIAAVVVQTLLWVMGSLLQTAYQRRQQKLALDLLHHQVETARTRHQHTQEERQSWQGQRKFVVTRAAPEGPGITSLYLKPHDGRRLPGFNPGQHLIFGFNIPGEGKPVNRCYSLSDGPNPEHYRITVKQVPAPKGKDVPPGKASSYINEAVKGGDFIDVKAPKGDFYLDLTKQHPVVMVGGGIGITPFISMITALAAQGFQREVWLFYGVRNPKEHAFRDYLEGLAQKYQNFHLHVSYSGIEPADLPKGQGYRIGHVGIDLIKERLASNNYEFYVCGPPAMMNSLVPALMEWGVSRNRIKFEAFGPASIKGLEPAKTASQPTVAAAGLKVTFSKSGKTLSWDSQQASLLAFGTANGVVMDSGCSAGECGTCEVAIKSGSVHYIKEPSEPPAAGNCLPCVCVPEGDLEIDA